MVVRKAHKAGRPITRNTSPSSRSSRFRRGYLAEQGARASNLEGSPQTFQAGVGGGQADGLWYCAWERKWLHDQSTSPPAAARDLASLKKFQRTSSYLASTSASERHIYSDAWARAGLGDPALIQQHVTANCRGLGVSRN